MSQGRVKSQASAVRSAGIAWESRLRGLRKRSDVRNVRLSLGSPSRSRAAGESREIPMNAQHHGRLPKSLSAGTSERQSRLEALESRRTAVRRLFSNHHGGLLIEADLAVYRPGRG